MPAKPKPLLKDNTSDAENTHCTLDTQQKVQVVVIAALQIRYPHKTIKTTTKLDDELGMDAEARAAILPGWMREATRRGRCETRLGSGAYRTMTTVRNIIDGIWKDLQKKCSL
jgi:hypothetical protein